MTPTPLFRPNTIAIEDRVHWALRMISTGLRGDGPMKSELTADGIATTLLNDAIEAKWPGLLAKFAQREAIDQEVIGKISASLKPTPATKE